MTTIATDGLVMAADSLAADAYGSCSVTKLRVVRGWLVGFAGRVSSGATLLRRMSASTLDPLAHLNALAAAKPKPDESVELLLVSPDGRLYVYEGGASEPWRIRDKVAAIGSGAPYAIGAMLSGVEPGPAVRIAARVDPSTGGRVRMIRRKNS